MLNSFFFRFANVSNLKVFQWLKEYAEDADITELKEEMMHDKPVPDVRPFFTCPSYIVNPEGEIIKSVSFHDTVDEECAWHLPCFSTERPLGYVQHLSTTANLLPCCRC